MKRFLTALSASVTAGMLFVSTGSVMAQSETPDRLICRRIPPNAGPSIVIRPPHKMVCPAGFVAVSFEEPGAITPIEPGLVIGRSASPG
jgi:hypothetical protein